MKKFLIFLLFLLIIGGVGFFFGWVQLDVPPGSYGVMRSKTHGIDPKVIREGEFRWCWYKLIPTNMEIKVFEVKPVYHEIHSTGSLPSGRLYAVFAGANTEFQWEVTGNFSFSIKGDALPELTKIHNLGDQEDFKAMEDMFTQRVETFIAHRLIGFGEDEHKMEAVLLLGSNTGLIREIEAAFPELENIECNIQALQIPDYELYRVLESIYSEYLVHQNRMLEEDAARNAEAWMGVRSRLNELEQYGEILSRYPILMEYLALERGLVLNSSRGE